MPVASEDLQSKHGRENQSTHNPKIENMDPIIRPQHQISPIVYPRNHQVASSENDELLAAMSEEQESLINKMLEGHNIYFTGKAGTGKSLVIKKFVNDFSSAYPDKKIAVVAPTGIAASLIGGQTFHSFASFPVQIEQYDGNKLKDLLENIRMTPWKRKAYTKTDVLVIDEASMLHPNLFDLLNIIMKDLRGSEKRHLPFGGLQIIICGDFFQLPPVVSQSSTDSLPSKHSWKTLNAKKEESSPYLFDSQAWKELINANMYMIELKKVFRQTDDEFLCILDEMRNGVCSRKTWNILKDHRCKIWPTDGILPTQLSAFRSNAEQRNTAELKSLDSGPTKVYEAIDFLKTDHGLASNDILCNPPTLEIVDGHFNSFQPDKFLHLKRLAQVILIRNLSLEDNLVNGAKGFIVDFVDVYDPLCGRVLSLPLVQFANGMQHVIGYVEFTAPLKVEDAYLVRRQLPLKLGWALTVHKSQGMTLERVDIDIHRAFAPGHAYVAISRVKHLSGLSLLNFSRKSLIPNRKVISFYASAFDKES